MNNPIGAQKAVWEIETTHPDLVEPIKNAMREVMDPEIGMSIIQLGLIRNVQVMDDSLVVNIIMTTPFCPYGPALLEQTKEKAQTASPYPVVLALGMEPWDFSMMEEPSAFEWGIYQ
jgi:metal-sulfur cluster biosynthetic enzyme